jgi:hypothetical protein
VNSMTPVSVMQPKTYIKGKTTKTNSMAAAPSSDLSKGPSSFRRNLFNKRRISVSSTKAATGSANHFHFYVSNFNEELFHKLETIH